MKEDGVIRDAKSEWASPVVLILKSDGSMRLCVDYRKLNKLTVRGSYPLSRMKDCLKSLDQPKYFTALDCNSVYLYITVSEEDRPKTAFTCHETASSFAECHSVSSIHPPRSRERLICCCPVTDGEKGMLKLDDIIVFTNTKEDHSADVREILTMLQHSGFTLKVRKCNFFAQSVDYLGHVIRPGKIEFAPKNTEAVEGLEEPCTQTELRSFLGVCNVYRCFVPNFTRIAAPLRAILRKACPVEIPSFTTDGARCA